MFELRQYATPRHPYAWQYRRARAWLIWEWKANHWNISIDPEAPVSTKELIKAIEDDQENAITRRRFHSKKQALKFLKSVLQ